MEIINPTQNAPMLAPPSPTKRLHSRSPSTSPTRPYSALGFDPLLRCLSPTSTLQALTTSSPAFRDSRSPSPRRLTLDASFKHVSDEQKELGIKAAQACLDIRGWTHELEGWDWPGCFEEPAPASKRARFSIMSIGSLASRQTTETYEDDEKHEFWGSLPAVVVKEYDERLQEISTQLDEIDLEDLKNYTLQAHTSPDTTPRLWQGEDELHPSSSSPDLRQLDDFTAVVTATILQTLPFVNRLARLLDDWSARVTILKAIPSFLHDIDRLRTDLDHGWAAVAVSLRKNGMYASLGADDMKTMQALIDSHMASLGQRLDSFLDLLEGRHDTVPDVFLDKFEELEERYAEWVVMAQQRVLGDELKEYHLDSSPPLTQLGRVSTDRSKTPTIRDGFDDPSRGPSVERGRTPTLLSAFDRGERARTPTFLSTSDVVDRAITPTIRDVASPAPSTPDEDFSREMDKSRILQDYERPTEKMLRTPPAGGFTALPQIAVIQVPAVDEAQMRGTSPSRSMRHVPIILPIDGDGSQYHPSPAASATNLHTQQSKLVELPDNDVAHPASPQKTPKSPVRQASNAIARLLKREKKQSGDAASQSPKSDTSSIFSSRRSLSKKRATKTADTMIWGGRPETPQSSKQRPETATRIVDYTATQSGPSDQERSQYEHGETLKRLEQPVELATPASIDQRPQTAVHSTPMTYQPKRQSRPSTSPREANFPDNWPLTPSELRSSAVLSPPFELPERHSRMLGPPYELPVHEPGTAITRDSIASQSNAPDLRTVHSMAAIGSDTFDQMFLEEFPSVPGEPNTAGFITFDSDDARSEAATEVVQTQLLDDTDEEIGVLGIVPSNSQRRLQSDDTDEDISVLGDVPSNPRKLSVPTVTSFMLSSDGRQDDLSVARAISIEGLSQFNHPPSLPEHNHKERYMGILKDDRSSSLPVDGFASGDDVSSLNDQTHSPPPKSAAALAALTAATRTAQHPRQEHPQHDGSIAGMAAVQAMIMHTQQPEYPPPVPSIPEDTHDDDDDEESTAVTKAVKRASMASIKSHLASEVRSIDVPARKSSGHSTPAFESAPGSRRNSLSYFQKSAYTRGGSRSGAQSPTSSIDTPNFSRLRSSSVDTNSEKAPLNASISKKRRTAPALETIQPSAEYETEPIASKTTRLPKRSVPVDEIDRHVSEVLEKIPAPIRFRARDVEASASPGPRALEAKPQHIRPRHAIAPRQVSGAGAMTLTPAEVSPKRSHEESGIKLYHLTQVGREEPIKLFVRLVGENDRVMVRVGGGWADLADYLRQYAEHHGSRTVSGTGLGFELQSTGTTPAGSRRTSGAAITPAERRAIQDAEASPSVAGAGILAQEDSTPTIDGRAELPGSDVEATLQSVDAKLQPRPNSMGRAKSALSTRSSRSDLREQKDTSSEHKAKWVKTMLEKARKETSGAKNRKDNAFGDMGKIGSTRRVIFRSPSALDERKSK